MIFKNPGNDPRPIFGGCHKPGVYSILIESDSGAFRGNGRAPHLLYKILGTENDGRGTGGMEYQSVNNSVDPIADRVFAVEFDAGTFCIPTTGELFLIGGDTSGTSLVRLFRHINAEVYAHWHELTTLLPIGGTMVIPDYHTEIAAWRAITACTLEGTNIDFEPGLWNRVIPGTTFKNTSETNTLMVATRWHG